jgi:hypothetical protein
MMRTLFMMIAFAACFAPCAAWSCDGPAGGAIALSTDGNRYTVTNMGKAQVTITFAAYGQSYTLSLAPGQSGTPTAGGLFNTPMKAYQSCIAIPVPAR